MPDATSAAQEAFAHALGALRRRERSRAELAEWLARRGYEQEDRIAALDRLEEVGELDDARFARRYAEDKRELSGWGPERIREALLARGVPLMEVEDALEADSHDEQLDRATELLERKGGDLDSDVARGRALGFLTRRGYEYEIAYEAVRRHAA
ncbi:MAG TPA: regulatory protein RecX [Solirubrobacterales bacterium]